MAGIGKGALAIALGHSLQEGELVRGESGWTMPVVHPTGKDWKVIYADVAKCDTQNECAAVILEAMRFTLNEGQEFEQLRKYAEKMAADTADTATPLFLLLLNHCDSVIRSNREQFQSLLRAIVPAFRVVTTSCTQITDLHVSVQSVDLEPLDASSTCEVLVSLCPADRGLTEELAKKFANLCSGMPIVIKIVVATLALQSRTLIEWLELLSKRSADSDVLETMARKMPLADDARRNVTACIQTVFDSLTVEEQNQTMCLTLFSNWFSTEEAAIVLGMEESVVLDLMVQLELRSLRQKIGKGWFSLQSIVHSFLKAKCKHENPVDYQAARVRFAKHFGAQFCKASAIYAKEPKRALSLFQSVEANFEQFRKFVFDEELADVCIEFAISSELLLKVVMSSSARAEFFESCASSARLRGLWRTYVWLKIREINAVLDDHNCDLEKAKSLMKEVKARDLDDDRLLCVERLIAEAQLCLCDNDPHRSLRLITSVCEKNQDVLRTSPLMAASAYSTFGNVAEDLNKPSMALSYYAKGIDVYASSIGVKVPEHPFVCTIQLQMARCHFRVKDFSRSSELFSRVLRVQTGFGCDRLSLAVTSYHLGIAEACASATGKEKTLYDSNALTHLQTALDEVERLTNDHPLLVLAPMALGKIHFWYGVCSSVGKRAAENIDTACRYFRKAVQCCDESSAFDRDLWKLEGLAYLSIPLPSKKTHDFQSKIDECRYHAELLTSQEVEIPAIVQLVISQDFTKRTSLDFTLRKCKWGFAGCLSALARQPQAVGDYQTLDSLNLLSERVQKRSHDFDPSLRQRSSTDCNSNSSTRNRVEVRRSLTASLLTSMYLLPMRRKKTVEKDV